MAARFRVRTQVTCPLPLGTPVGPRGTTTLPFRLRMAIAHGRRGPKPQTHEPSRTLAAYHVVTIQDPAALLAAGSF